VPPQCGRKEVTYGRLESNSSRPKYRAFVELFADGTALASGLQAAEQKLRVWGRLMRRLGTEVMLAGAAGVATGIRGLFSFMEQGSALQNLGANTATSAAEMGALAYAVGTVGGNLSTVEHAFTSMNGLLLQANDGASGAADTLGELGVRFEDLERQAPVDRFYALVNALSRVESETRRAHLANQVFGGSYGQMAQLIRGGADAFRQLEREGLSRGAVLTDRQAAAAASLAVQWNVLKLQLGAVATQIGSALAPVMADVVGLLQRVLPYVVDFISTNQGLIVTIVEVSGGLVAAGVALHVLGHALSLASFAVTGLKLLVGGLGLVMSALVFLIKAPATLAWLAYSAACGVAAFATAAYTLVAEVCAAVLTGGLSVAVAAVGLAILALPAIIAVGVGAFLYLSGTWGQACDMIASSTAVMRTNVENAWGGIVAAFSSGNILIGMRLIGLGIESIWLGVKSFLLGLWDDMMLGFQTTWEHGLTFVAVGVTRWWFGMRGAWVIGVHAIETVWSGMLRAIVSGFRTAVGAIIYAWGFARHAIEHPLSGLQSHRDAAARMRDEVLSNVGQGPAAPAPLAGQLQQLRDELAEREQELNRIRDQRLSEEARGAGGRAQDRREEMQNVGDEITGLRNLLRRRGGGSIPPEYELPYSRLRRAAAGYGDHATLGSQGTFSAAQAAAFAGTTDARRTADNTARTADRVEELLDWMRNNGGIPAFG
jgi:hypothetical protein